MAQKRPAELVADEAQCALAALEVLDIGIVVSATHTGPILFANATAKQILETLECKGRELPAPIAEAARIYVESRDSVKRLPPAIRLERSDAPAVYMRVVPAIRLPRHEVITLREEILRDPELFRQLEGHFGITRRDFQILSGLRLGKTNRQIALEFGASEKTITKALHRLFERFGVSNRIGLANAVERIAGRRH